MTTISNSDDIIDSRDVIARIEELAALFETCAACGSEIDRDTAAERACECGPGEQPITATTWDEAVELEVLRKLADQAEGCADWKYGEALIRDSYFAEYAEQLADDLGIINDDATSRWPLYCIDWERAARDLKMDYTEVDFGGVSYWIRS